MVVTQADVGWGLWGTTNANQSCNILRAVDVRGVAPIDGGVTTCGFNLFVSDAMEAVVDRVCFFLLNVFVFFLIAEVVMVVQGHLLGRVVVEGLMLLSSKEGILLGCVVVGVAIVGANGVGVIALLGVPVVIIELIAFLNGVDAGGKCVDLVCEVCHKLFEALFHHLEDGGHF